ncbi:hypothetical protein [Leifsonia sp. Le1]|uniref:hypothetical protein n=1 Tax=Leifsonia sp. Le1 TaxID=3404918 RepID=UPI003EB81169
MKKIKSTLVVLGAAAFATVGLATGAAFADGIPAVPAPHGLVAADGTPTTPKAEPKFKANARGLTFGSAMSATSPTNEPDLILVVATNGLEGYVLKSDLHKAEGTGFASPAEALAWQASIQGKDQTLSVYTSDGSTVIGEFVVKATSGAVAQK